ncbi:copper-binding protein [Caballeronia sp. CLC5]|uniref:copper-binding protein n=2 Tax=unclassified Caballeronia TaxID=2646786 RepID=UPI001F39C713|nr:copper-binding protein [Caballeronia sp. CLC5]MCE4570232.1 copper-binding protein [Caballeronia sp. CLC5]
MAASTGSAFAQSDALAKTAEQVAMSENPVHLQSVIKGIDTANRVLMLQDQNGDVMLPVGKQATNFDKLKVGDIVDVYYKNALLMDISKSTAADKSDRARVDTTVVAPASGANVVAGFDAVRQVEVLATVVKVDAAKRTITLRGPLHIMSLDIAKDVDVSKLKNGDKVHAVYVAAMAVKVTPPAATASN